MLKQHILFIFFKTKNRDRQQEMFGGITAGKIVDKCIGKLRTSMELSVQFLH